MNITVASILVKTHRTYESFRFDLGAKFSIEFLDVAYIYHTMVGQPRYIRLPYHREHSTSVYHETHSGDKTIYRSQP